MPNKTSSISFIYSVYKLGLTNSIVLFILVRRITLLSSVIYSDYLLLTSKNVESSKPYILSLLLLECLIIILTFFSKLSNYFLL